MSATEAWVKRFLDAPASGIGAAIRRCHGCARPQSEDCPLSRCSRCQKAFFCSRECQKAVWPVHKPMCYSNAAAYEGSTTFKTELRTIGFTDPAAFRETFSDFVDAHAWALLMCTKAYVLEEGGITWSQNPQKILYLELIPSRSLMLSTGCQPSRAFKLNDHGFLNLEDYLKASPQVAADWAQGEAPRTAATAMCRNVHPAFVGLLPVLFRIKGVASTTCLRYFPQYRAEREPEMDEDVKKVVIKDILTLLVGSINEDFPFRSLGDRLPGQFVWVQGTWTWQALFPDWSQYQIGEHRGIDKTLEMMETSLTPMELIHMIRSL